MSDEFADPSTATGIEWDKLKGSLLLISVHAHETGIKTAYGEADAVRADVVVLDGDAEGAEYLDTLIFPKVMQSQLRPRIGGKVLGRLGQGHKKPGQSAPWTLAAAEESDKKVAREYVASKAVADTPF